MIVVSNASPITALLQVDRADLLQRLFGEVLVPPSVHAELRRFHTAVPTFVRVQPLKDTAASAALAGSLDLGEAEAIVLAQEVKADYLLIDENKGRAVASERGLRVIGLLGVLLLGRKSGLVDSVAHTIRELESRARFFVSDAVKKVILKAAGEL